MDIPDEVLRQAVNATDVLEPAYTEDVTDAVYAGAQVIAEWARKEALREAAEFVKGTRKPLVADPEERNRVMATNARNQFIESHLRALAEGISDGQQ